MSKLVSKNLLSWSAGPMTNSAKSAPRRTDYRKRAEECVAIAQTARTSEQRTMLLHIAETWLRLADSATFEIAEDFGKPAAGSVTAA